MDDEKCKDVQMLLPALSTGMGKACPWRKVGQGGAAPSTMLLIGAARILPIVASVNAMRSANATPMIATVGCNVKRHWRRLRNDKRR